MFLSNVIGLVIALAIGAVGAVIAIKFKFPAAPFLGPVLLLGAYQVLFGSLASRPMWFRFGVQIAVGIILGVSFADISISTLKGLLKPALTICFIMVGGGLVGGFIIYRYTGWDIATSILSVAPGGQAEMVLFAESVGATTEKVLVLQFLRSQLVMLVMLPLLRIFYKDEGKELEL